MAVINVEDANGMKFTIDDSKIQDINGDLVDSAGNPCSANISDSIQKIKPHKVEVVDSVGNVVDRTSIIADMKSGNKNVIALDVQAESTHSGKNYNYCIYYEDSMEKDAESFLAPYQKPMLKNHDSYRGEPLGRITKAWFGPSALTDERSAIHTVTRITDQDAIEKFLDGRYQTLSIGGTMGTVTCNICGKTILKDGKFKWCGHYRGEAYKDQVCYWGARDITYHEHSTVNNPADDYAQVVKLTVITDKDKKDNNDSTQEGGNYTMDEKNANETKQKVCDFIDSLIGKKPNTTQTQDNNNQADGQGQQQEGQQVTDNNQNSQQNTDTNVQELQNKLNDAIAAKEKAEKDLVDSKLKTAEAEKQRDDALADAKLYKEKCVTLAQEYKSIIADSIIEKENVEDATIRKKELIAMSMNELNAVHDSLSRQQRRTPGTAQNPTLPNGNENNAPVGNNNDSNSGGSNTADTGKNKYTTVDDYVNRIVNRNRQ